mmetsp:Transcript_32050/g.75168  ORF Transcript_32050/g.75168 Transcript_32050/m.75168 type:complete len:557 (-) Transcript_32050:152-1822(-)
MLLPKWWCLALIGRGLATNSTTNSHVDTEAETPFFPSIHGYGWYAGTNFSAQGSDASDMGFGYHADPFADLPRDGAAMLLAAGTLVIAASGGIGGGGILVPLYIIILRFRPKHAIALSNFTILGGAIANTATNLHRRHPQLDRHLIDWDLIIIMEPLTIFGAVFGSLLSKVLPNVVLNFSLAAILLYTGHRTFLKGVKMWKEESRRLLLSASALEVGVELPRTSSGGERITPGAAPLLEKCDAEDMDYNATRSWTSPPPSAAGGSGSNSSEPAYYSLNDSDKSAHSGSNSPAAVSMVSIPLYDSRNSAKSCEFEPVATSSSAQLNVRAKVASLTVCLSGTCMLTVMKGGGHFQSPFGIHCGSLWFWLLYFGALPWVLVFALYFRRILINEYKHKVATGYSFTKGEVMWSPTNTIKYPVICAFSGLVAGMFGVGGGIVKGPLMLEMGVIPSVASASAAAMVLFTSLAASTSFFVFGLLHMGYGCIFFLLGIGSTVCGQQLISRCTKQHDRQSPPVLSIGFVILLSAALIGCNTLIRMLGGDGSKILECQDVCTQDVQ